MQKGVTWNFHADFLQGHHRYSMILGCDIFSKLNIDFFSNNIIRKNGGMYKRCTSPMKYDSKFNLNLSSDWIQDKIF